MGSMLVRGLGNEGYSGIFPDQPEPCVLAGSNGESLQEANENEDPGSKINIIGFLGYCREIAKDNGLVDSGQKESQF